jgi:transposase
MRAASEPEALGAALRATGLSLERIGLEACSLAAWLHDGLRDAGLPAICIETRQANAAMRTMPNKTDRNDARMLAQIMRTGWFRQVHVKRSDQSGQASRPECASWPTATGWSSGSSSRFLGFSLPCWSSWPA